MTSACVRTFLLLALVQFSHGDISKTLLDQCEIKIEPIGCYEDVTVDRAMEKELLNARDETSEAYAGYIHGWGKEYETFLPKFLCACAKIAVKKGYRIMGMQFFGECWSSFESHRFFLKHGSTGTCLNEKFKPCAKNDVLCTGMQTTNYIYRIAPTACDTYYQPIGCFNDQGLEPRPLPLYAMNERDYNSWNYNGRLIDWKDWNVYSTYLICRCAEMAMEMNHDLFGLQFYGECWTGKKGVAKYQKDGVSTRCLGKDFDSCPYNSYHCVGMDHANRIYELISAPTKMSSAIPESDASKYT